MIYRFRTAAWTIAAALALSVDVSVAAEAPKGARKADEAKAEEIKVIKPEEAKDYLDKVVAVEFTVVRSRELLEKNIIFLNSERDYKSPTNFTAFISDAKNFKTAAKIEQPADHYLKKKVRVTGKVIKYQDKWEIEVDSPEQIQIVEEKETESTKKSST